MVDSAAAAAAGRRAAVPELRDLDQYDITRAKICSSVGWILSKSYSSAENVPAELRDPFYQDQYEQEHLKPPVTRLLQSPELYCRTYGLLLTGGPGSKDPPKDNAALLQLLSQKGLTPRDQSGPVTEADLRHRPIRMSAHLAVIDALMAVGAMETVRASGGVERLRGEEDWERALLHWVNQVNQKLKRYCESDPTQPTSEPQSVEPSLRYRKDKLLSKQQPYFPAVREVKDLSSGCALAAVIHHYCPDLLHLEDVCMKESMSLNESLYNLQLIREFCDSCLKSCCHLVLEDMHYSPPELQVNILSFVAELLHWFEVAKPDFVQPLDSPDVADSSGRKENGGSGSANSSPSLFRKPFLPISSPATPIPEAVGRSWTKNPLSRPLSSAVSFSIPFGLDSDVDIVMGNPVIMRSASSDCLNPVGQPVNHAPYVSPEDISRTPVASSPHRASWAPRSPAVPLLAQENGLEESNSAELPTIEEALQIINNEDKMEPRSHPEGAPDGFYLHSPDDPGSRRFSGNADVLGGSAPSNSGMYRSTGTARGKRRPSDSSRDDDSVLRDGSVDSDASEDLPKARSTPATPANSARAATPSGQETPDSGVRMTSFAELKKKGSTELPAQGNPADSHMTTWAAKKTQETPSKSPALSSEMSEIGARLEEKRKAIEAQKKRIEAIFAKHRQRLGKSAFLQLKKEQEDEDGEEGIPLENFRRLSLDERLARMESDGDGEERVKQLSQVVDEGNLKASGQEKAPGERSAAPLGDYNNAVLKLNSALSSLQSDMQRLAEQQKQLIRKKMPSTNESWVIPPSSKTSTPSGPPRLSRESTRDLNSNASSPSMPRRLGTQAAPPKSPASHRRAQSAPPKSPKSQSSRMADAKAPALTRVITAPHSVDNIPHRRRVSPWQYRDQNSSTFSINSSFESRSSSQLSRPEDGHSDTDTIFSLDLEGGPSLPRREHRGGGSSSGAASEYSFESDAPSAGLGSKRGSLIEIPLSSLRNIDGEEAELIPDTTSDSMSDHTEPELRGGVGFFFKDEARPEDEMEKRRAALLEKQQKRAEELKRKKQEQEQEREARRNSVDELRTDEKMERPQTPRTPPPRTPPPRTPPPESTQHRRGVFTRQEYERRHQLKIMEDLDKVLRQKPTTVRGVKKQRPRTVFRDDSGLSRSPSRGVIGSRLNKVYSHSTMNLSSMASDGGTLSVRKSPSRSHSPARMRSPGRVPSQNGDKDWENASTLSSPASIPEYTGPKLYKEPSFKSNKFIINNALSRCCLAGKVNEPQKNKIIEEMEKSSANHFLILFRDSSCQFRAVYTMNPETEELERLTGIGPRLIDLSMVESIYKYSSDRKQFTVIPSKTMSMSVDAFTIPGQLWQAKRPGTPKKLGTPK